MIFLDRVLLYFQDLGQRDIEIAAKFGLPYGGGPNCGIADGMRNAATELGTDYVLFLETIARSSKHGMRWNFS